MQIVVRHPGRIRPLRCGEGAADGLLLVGVRLARSDNTAETRYFHTDHLGSVTLITNQAGGVVERLAYAAFGKRRYPSGADDPTNAIFGITTDRGFTSHEYLDEITLIHMNGRIYDPVLARFVTPDPQVQAAASIQAYNRYAYGFSNLLSGIDPSGYGGVTDFFSDPIQTLKNTVENVVGSDFGKTVVIAGLAWYTGGLVSNWMITSAANGFAIGANGLSTALVTLGGEAGALTALGSAVSGAAAGFTGGLLASGGDFEFALKSGAAVGLTAGLGQLGGNFAGAPGSIAGRGLGSGMSSQAFGAGFAEGLKNGLLSAVRSQAYSYAHEATNRSSYASGNRMYDRDTGDLATAGTRPCTGDCSSVLDRIGMSPEYQGAAGEIGGQYRPRSWYDNIAPVRTFINAVSKVHDVMNSWSYDSSGKYIGRGEPFNSVFNVYSFAAMVPAAKFTADALFSNPLRVNRVQ